ncbi:MAG: exodeoxyribonuclease VII large subunit [candidate division KSB1 bacterium]|nr:exodeoxyribonuclease VII large subunit [candidate division KSB1 bacterium]MDZ7319543.1 exodeoxyribonuclease VII large subunit [candidate division KSB1 bacterium]MDZ7339812.1 exodeoxyribonuclease VII large subunit [candidate division KSB1 bacterium]
MLEIQSELDIPQVYSVAELTREIKVLLETSLPVCWVEGEISNFKIHTSGHFYFSLKDNDAQLPCVMWRSRNVALFFTPQDGMKVRALGRVTVYEKRGYYQFDVIKLQPVGVGELQQAFEQLKRKLHAEGLFDAQYKQPLPRYPQRIGIVTSPTGAVIQDLVTIINRRFRGVEIILKPVRVQGEGAAVEIANAIDMFNEYGKVDVLIIGRGGGSLEDLWAFNEETVARAIFRSKIPIISAVGHEVDFTISDFVADVRAATPSAAAELAVPDQADVRKQLRFLQQQLTDITMARIHGERERLQALLNSYSFRRTPDRIRQFQQRVDELQHALELSVTHHLDLVSQHLQSLTQRLKALAPAAILKRGYSICLRARNQQLITQASALQVDETIRVQFYQGHVLGTVNEIDPINSVLKIGGQDDGCMESPE